MVERVWRIAATARTKDLALCHFRQAKAAIGNKLFCRCNIQSCSKTLCFQSLLLHISKVLLQHLLKNCVCVQDSESAQKAVEELNGTEMFGKTLYVSRL